MNNTLLLNFFALEQYPANLIFYEKKVNKNTPKEIDTYRIFKNNNEAFDLLIYPKEGYEKVNYKFDFLITNPYLIQFYISNALIHNALNTYGDKITDRKKSLNLYYDLCVTTENLKYGKRVMRITPKFLDKKSTIGLTIKEEYWKNSGASFGKQIMMEDGTYDSKGSPNVAYHQQALTRLKNFVTSKETQKLLSSLSIESNQAQPFKFSTEMETIEFNSFQSREFIVGSGNKCRNTLSGISLHGPMRPVHDTVRLLFISREEERVIARNLYTGLINGNDKIKPQELLKCKMEIHPRKFIKISSFDNLGIEELNQTLSSFTEEEKKNTIAICVLPDKDERSYYNFKSALMRHNINSQCCTKMLIASAYSFKWALANISLGVFAKAGGIPWRVYPHNSNSVILGIGQSVEKLTSHSRANHTDIVKHRTFSVLTDSTGEFCKLDDLASSTNCDDDAYVLKFITRIKEVFQDHASRINNTDLVVLHTPFNLKRKLMKGLEAVVKEISTKTRKNFVVIKFNSTTENWFGFSQENNRTPIEGSYCAVSNNEYLIWFEGSDRYTKQSKRRCSAPANLKIIGDLPSDVNVKRILQDAYDLAGANWRGFNAKGLPVSMYYCKLISDFIKGFHQAGLESPEIENLNPWFL